jgi:hypothetical protein
MGDVFQLFRQLPAWISACAEMPDVGISLTTTVIPERVSAANAYAGPRAALAPTAACGSQLQNPSAVPAQAGTQAWFGCCAFDFSLQHAS